MQKGLFLIRFIRFGYKILPRNGLRNLTREQFWRRMRAMALSIGITCGAKTSWWYELFAHRTNSRWRLAPPARTLAPRGRVRDGVEGREGENHQHDRGRYGPDRLTGQAGRRPGGARSEAARAAGSPVAAGGVGRDCRQPEAKEDRKRRELLCPRRIAALAPCVSELLRGFPSTE